MFQFDGFVIKLCKSRIFFSYLFYLAIEQITVVGIGVATLFLVDPSVALALNDLAELAKCDMDRPILLRCTHT
jgi:hypothetical protein